jgi:CMP-N,N'-diacetyllegionaminic acid synthase
MGFRVLALIAARSGSRDLPHKNIQKVAGVPLLVRAVRLAQGSRRTGEAWRIVVSTDSARYARLALSAGADVPWLRPRRLATTRARLIDVVLHSLRTLARGGEHFDGVLLLPVTTPLTTTADVRRCVTLFKSQRRAVVSVVKDTIPDAWRFAVRHGRLHAVGKSSRVSRRQEAPQRYRLNGALFMAAPAWIIRHGQFFSDGETLPLVMPPERSLDIETHFELALARFLVSRNSKGIRRWV